MHFFYLFFYTYIYCRKFNAAFNKLIQYQCTKCAKLVDEIMCVNSKIRDIDYDYVC